MQQPAANACTGPADAQPSGVQQAATAAAAASCVAGDGQNHPDNHQHTAGAGHQQPQQQMPSSLPSCPAASAVVGQQDGQQQQQPSEQQLPAAALQLQAQLSGLPAAVRQQVAQLHKEFEDTCSSFQQKKEAALAAVTARQQVRAQCAVCCEWEMAAHPPAAAAQFEYSSLQCNQCIVLRVTEDDYINHPDPCLTCLPVCFCLMFLLLCPGGEQHC